MTLALSRSDARSTTAPVPPSELRRLVLRYAANPNLSALLTDTGWHDHGDAAGAFAVASGVLVEETWALGAVQTQRLLTGDARSFGRHHVHNVRGAGPGRSFTVHAYAPGLVTMGGYDLTSGGPVPTTTSTEESW